jgi:hypothetical protein
VPYRLVEIFKEILREEFVVVIKALAQEPGFKHLNESYPPHPTNPTEK